MSQAPGGIPRDEEEARTISTGNNQAVSIILFVVIFLAFCVGLYIMSLLTPVLFLAGLGIVLVSLFCAFTVVPKLLT